VLDVERLVRLVTGLYCNRFNFELRKNFASVLTELLLLPLPSPSATGMMPPSNSRKRGGVPVNVIQAVIKRKTRVQLLKDKYDPRSFQLDASLRIARGEDTILIAPTGSGKTLVLAMPLLYHDKKTSIVISPLQALETDQVKKMIEAGVPSYLIDTIALPDLLVRGGEDCCQKVR
jgi:ATP-dependent helicase YprA (DUF1998 family)